MSTSSNRISWVLWNFAKDGSLQSFIVSLSHSFFFFFFHVKRNAVEMNKSGHLKEMYTHSRKSLFFFVVHSQRMGPDCFIFPWQIDVDDIKFVVNFDYPNCSEDYVHRIGRTGRVTKTGTAYTFFTPGNIKQASELINILREAKQQVNPKLIQMAESARGMSRGKISTVLTAYICTQEI